MTEIAPIIRLERVDTTVAIAHERAAAEAAEDRHHGGEV